MTPVILMAGGRGLRLHPLTEKHPKSLLKVGGKPILEQIIDGFARQGFRRFWLCVNYKADLIKDYFGDGGVRGLKIKYIHETEPLGTGGALRLLPAFDVPFILCNADVLAKIEYGDLMEYHARANVQATVCAALSQRQGPYGVLDVEPAPGSTAIRLISLREKPIEGTLVNAGVYVLDPKALDLAPEGHFDMPELIDRLDRVAAYPIEGYWVDVGSFIDLAMANTEWAA
ncbi:MAG TPA: hypothetical protein ENH55_13345 [Aurantimonas coralicida]|uniref:Nucleotidyl transferase domain-containing protein n=2 Tax=root TaxID=1 RepID=A0A9C9TFS7_9HYPH|nr:hypothetical protein [Aurantimonas coralicida]HET99654.1 hypothetical protein [Aurantimonas coralicida]